MSTNNNQSVVLGSGWLYAAPYSSIANPFSLTEAEKAALVNIGYIESNAKLTAKSKVVPVTAANAGKVAQFHGDKDVSFETGIISWNLENVSKFLTGSDFTETSGKKTFSYANSDCAPKVFLRFIYSDESEGKVITIDMFCCQFNGDLTLDFNTKNPITFDYSFDLISKSNGTKNIYFNIDEVVTVLSSIAVTTAPTKTTYTVGSALNLAGMVVTATYSDNSTAVITGYTASPANGASLTALNTSVTISYTENSITKTTTQTITVS